VVGEGGQRTGRPVLHRRDPQRRVGHRGRAGGLVGRRRQRGEARWPGGVVVDGGQPGSRDQPDDEGGKDDPQHAAFTHAGWTS
jgi:hypothetical protein